MCLIRYNRDHLLDLSAVSRNHTIPNKGTLTILKQYNLLKYRGTRGGRDQELRVWDTNSGVNLNNLQSLPSQIPTVTSLKRHSTHNISDANLNNLSYPKKCNTLNGLNEKISCLTLNCHSVVRNKDVLIGQYLREEKIDFAVFTETWFSDEKLHQIDTSDLNQNGYTMSTVNRSNRTGGGVALTCRTGVTVRDGALELKGSQSMGDGRILLKHPCDDSFKKVLSNEPNFGRIHLAGQYL